MTEATPLPQVDSNGLEILTSEECHRSLSRGGIGRLAFVDEGLPTILPVNFHLSDEQIVITTGIGSILRAAEHGQLVAFEVDGTDPMYHGGLSVLLRGHARELREEEQTEATTGPLRAWGNTEADRFVAVSIEILTGRRIGCPTITRRHPGAVGQSPVRRAVNPTSNIEVMDRQECLQL
jgi:hypothetical protein